MTTEHPPDWRLDERREAALARLHRMDRRDSPSDIWPWPIGKQTPKWKRVLEEMRAHYEPESAAACYILDEFERRMEQS